jgi:nitrilase
MAGDHLPSVRAAVVQASPCLLDREATVEKACGLIERAGREGAEVVVFPEGFIPSHPVWFHFHPATGRRAIELAAELFRNAVVVGGPVTERLGAAARAAGCWVVMGVCEKAPGTTGTMWNSIVHVAPDGRVAHVHRKLTPTVGERLVHSGGSGAGLQAVQTEFGAMTGLLCAENSNPLAVFSVAAQSSVLHAALWPNHFSASQPPMPRIILTTSQALAYRCGCFVLNAASTLAREDRERIAYTDEDRRWLAEASNLGGSCIVDPAGRLLAGPLGDEEGLLVADLELDAIIAKKALHDYAGHYNRADVFTLAIADAPSPIFEAPWLAPAEPSVAAPPDEPATAPVGGAAADGAAPEPEVAP